jgi:hypothetical protein
MVIPLLIPRDSPSLLRFCDAQSARSFTIEPLCHDQALHRLETKNFYRSRVRLLQSEQEALMPGIKFCVMSRRLRALQ